MYKCMNIHGIPTFVDFMGSSAPELRCLSLNYLKIFRLLKTAETIFKYTNFLQFTKYRYPLKKNL